MRTLWAAATTLLMLTSPAWSQPRFHEDDPLWQIADTQDASGMQAISVDLLYDLLENSYTKPGDPVARRALNANTVDEVPDSSWFTNRIVARPVTLEEVRRGPSTGDGPAPGRWRVIQGKTQGITPGMRILDSAGELYFVKFDPPQNLEMATGAEVVVTKLFHVLGYNVPENHIAFIHPDDLVVSEDAVKSYADGREARFTSRDLRRVFDKAARQADGSYRVLASKALPGKPIGPFRYHGTRSDDPNDIFPHEHLRELRALWVFGGWTNHVDAKAGNSQDVLVDQADRKVVRHYLIDFGAALGSGSIHPHEAFEGFEYLVERDEVWKRALSFGFRIPPWGTIRTPDLPGVGRLEAARFDHTGWKPRYPNPAFLRARPDDTFWAARRVMAVSDAMIRAAVETGRYSDPRAEQYLIEMLIERRDKIGRAFLPIVNPLVDLSLENGVLSFVNAAVEAGVAKAPTGYLATWHRFDNETAETQPVGSTTSQTAAIRAPQDLPEEPDLIVRVDVVALEPPHPRWSKPLHAYFRRIPGGWKLVGLERLTAD